LGSRLQIQRHRIKMLRRENKGLSSRLISFTVWFAAGFTIILSFFIYQIQINIYEDKELSRLQAISRTLSVDLSGESLTILKNKYPNKDDIKSIEQDSLYAFMRHHMVLAKQENKLETTIYTMTYDSISKGFVFLLSTSEMPYWRHKYTESPVILLEKYQNGGLIPPYQDENGTWLSAFSPVRDKHGNVTAILQVDARFDHFIQEARSRIIINLLLSLLIMGIVAGIMIYVLRKIGKSKDRIDQERMELDILKKELIANVSHDLRTPLASIQGYIETVLLMKDKLSEERKDRYLRTSLSSAQRLRVLIDELFEISILESRSRKLKLEEINTSEFLLDTALAFRNSASEKQITCECDVPTNLPPIKVEVALFDRLLQNIIGNSLKYCNPGDTIKLSAKVNQGKLRVEISDSGPGIDAKDLPHIFDRFRRGNPEKPGTGLGLAIVKSILELHQAAYSIESEVGKGTTFWFELKI